MAKYIDPATKQLMDMLDPLVHDALRLIDRRTERLHDAAWPYVKTNGGFVITIEYHRLSDEHVVYWQSTQSPPVTQRSRLIARLLGKTVGDHLTLRIDRSSSILQPDRSSSILWVDNSELKCAVHYWSGGFPGKITIASRRHITTAEDVNAYLRQHPLPTIPTDED